MGHRGPPSATVGHRGPFFYSKSQSKSELKLKLKNLTLFTVALAAPDNAGRDFVFAFGANTNTGGSLEVYVLTQKEYAVSFNYTRNGAVEVVHLLFISLLCYYI